jgi:hypothetical protein
LKIRRSIDDFQESSTSASTTPICGNQRRAELRLFAGNQIPTMAMTNQLVRQQSARRASRTNRRARGRKHKAPIPTEWGLLRIPRRDYIGDNPVTALVDPAAPVVGNDH